MLKANADQLSPHELLVGLHGLPPRPPSASPPPGTMPCTCGWYVIAERQMHRTAVLWQFGQCRLRHEFHLACNETTGPREPGKSMTVAMPDRQI